MAHAFATENSVVADGTSGLEITLDVTYTGADIPTSLSDSGRAWSRVSAKVNAGDQPAAFRLAISAAVEQEAARLGFTCPGANQVLPAYQKG